MLEKKEQKGYRLCVWRGVLLLLGLFCVAGGEGCSACTGNIDVTLPGCEDCPDRCLRTKNNVGRCVECLNDKQCQSKTSPTKRCTEEHKCICGSDKDCGKGYCDAQRGTCLACLEDSHCTAPDRPFCVFDACQECKPNSLRSCAPTDLDICVKGTQTCSATGLWEACEGWEACKGCSRAPECQLGQKKCTTGEKEKPGQYYPCVRDEKGCLVWDDKEESCGADRTCKNGECHPSRCPDPVCQLGETRCIDEDNMEVCVRDAKDCIVWEKKACASDEKCKAPATRCSGTCQPEQELCNQKDDDCDGQVDEDFTDLGQPCEVGKGICKNKGTKICSNDGKKTVCSVNPGQPSTELCNGKDDDCDGQIDNGAKCPNGQPCVNGSCGKAEPGCADGTRELFQDRSKFPLIAGCAGFWRGESLRKARTNNSKCGNDKNNACPSAEDLCAKGWHICMRNGQPTDLTTRVSTQDCDNNGPGLFVAASSHCSTDKPICKYGAGALPCTKGGPCSEPICCGKDCDFGLCKGGVWLNKTKCARPKTFIGCGNCNSFHGSPTLNGVLCCKDSP